MPEPAFRITNAEKGRTIELGERRIEIDEIFHRAKASELARPEQWAHVRVLSTGTRGENVTTHLISTPKRMLVARVVPTPQGFSTALGNLTYTLMEAHRRRVKIEKPLGAFTGTEPEGHVIVHLSEYIPGKTLEQTRFGNWNQKKRIELAAGIIKLLKSFHDRNVVHNHFHPRNILVREDGRPAAIDATQMSFIGEDPCNYKNLRERAFARTSGLNAKLFDLSTFTRNAMPPAGEEKPAGGWRRYLLRDEGELRTALEKSGYNLPGLNLDEIIATLHEYRRI